MAICQFFLRGTCKFGANCKNEHPADRPTGFGNQSWNASRSTATVEVAFSSDSMKNDLTPQKDKPLWPLSSYGAAKNEPCLIRDQDESPEELRLRAVMALKAGNVNDYMKYESEKIAAAEQVIENARNNITSAYDQAVKLSKEGGAAGRTAGVSTGSATSAFGASSSTPSAPGSSAFGGSVFGSSSTTTPSAFGSTAAPSAFGTSAFGKAAFGQPASGQSAFGQSAFGQAAPATGTSAFGQPAQTTTAPASVFGQPSQPTSAFGQTSQPASAFGQTSQPASAFGQTSQPTSAFGQTSQPTSVFGQASQPASAFGQTSQPTPAFGQTSQPPTSLIKPATTGAFSAFANNPSSSSGASAFGAGSTGGGGAFSAFAGKPSAFGLGAGAAAPSTTTPQTGGSVFGQSAFGASSSQTQQPSAFGTPAAAPAPAFNALSSTAPSVFGSASGQQQTQPAQSAFSAFGQQQPSQPTQSAFGGLGGQQPAAQPVFGNSSFGTQPTSAFGNSSGGSPFNAASNTTASPFAPASNTATPSVFASSSTTTPSAFAPQASAFGNSTQSAFGNADSQSPFGKPQQPSVFGQSAFGSGSAPAQPTLSAFNQPAPAAVAVAPTKVTQSTPDFAAAMSASGYKPGKSPFDPLLPPNYMELIPTEALEAFRSQIFEWGKVPEWIPPLELR